MFFAYIMFALLALWTATVMALTGALLTSLVLGGILSGYKKTKRIAPVFLIIIPSAVVGALCGGVGIVYIIFQDKCNHILLGPIGGAVIGGQLGLLLGGGLAALWWSYRKPAYNKIVKNTDREQV